MSNKLLNFSTSSTSSCGGGGKSPDCGDGGDKTITRHILVTISGNRATWEHLGQHGGLWQVNPERANVIFCSEAGTSDPIHVKDKLSRALIKKVTVLETNTNIDEVVAVSIDGLPPKEFTANGDGASLFLTGEGKVTAPQEVFNLSGNTEIGLAWMQQFPRYTAQNIDDEGAMHLDGSSYYFVEIAHPVVHFLKTNEAQLGVHICPETMMDGRWYKIDVEVFMYSVESLRNTILHNAPSTFNLTALTVRIAKPDGQRWLQFSPQIIDSLLSPEIRNCGDAATIQQAKVLAVERYLDKPLFLTMRLAFEYTLPDIPSCADPATAASKMITAAAGVK